MPSIGDQPIEKEYHAQMNAIAEVLDEAFNGSDRNKKKTTGFVLLVFPFYNHEGRCNYISNGAREDVIVLLKEQLARFEGRYQEEKKV